MTTATDTFFADLAERGPEPRLQRASGTLRVDLSNGEHWFLDIHKGRVAVSRRNDPADTVVSTSPEIFEQLSRGETNAMAAMLRNDIMFEGAPALGVLVRKLFPQPHPVAQEGRSQ
jgi:putative sterol carrier protein